MYTNMCTLMIAIDMQALTPAILAQGTVLLRNNIYRRTYLYTYVYIYIELVESVLQDGALQKSIDGTAAGCEDLLRTKQA